MRVEEQIDLGRAVLALPMQDNDAGAKTIREYLIMLAHKCWAKADSFSGKRPFGNSGWDYEIYTALAKGKLIEAKFDEYDGYCDLIEFDEGKANRLVRYAFNELGSSYE